ncbi:MAG: hypothetical protein KF773_03105 [Deltaproteobacteria bacterium]|nr:hypothetical protein [Deltaproteobacteria bacterium]MCW5804742.1 hypothetical protein [Deltaproteobacteria bacterium]
MPKIALVTLLFAAACGGTAGNEPTPDASQFGVACTSATFDPCTANEQCMSANCHLFRQDGIQVCTASCTPFDDTTCPVDSTGAHGKCNMRGICKPAAANACDR